MNEKGKEIQLIGPPFEYEGDEEADKPCMCGECGNTATANQPELDKQWPDPKIEVNDED